MGSPKNLNREQAKDRQLKDIEYFDLQGIKANTSLTKRQIIKDLKIKSKCIRKATYMINKM